MEKKILITGATGYIGKPLIKTLLEKDFILKVLVRNKRNLPEFTRGNSKVVIYEGDLTNIPILKKATKDVDLIFHLAAELRMFEKNKQLYRVNILGLKNLLAALENQPKKVRLIFASSIDVEKRKTDYAQSKQQGEKIVKEFCGQNPQVAYQIVRIGNVYGGEGGGMVEGIKEIMEKNNWQSSILYHQLGQKILFTIGMKNLIKKLISFIDDEENKVVHLIDEEITVKNLVDRLFSQKEITSFPPKLPLGSLILKIWESLGRITKRGDLLVYLSLGK